ncbi:hypothetical protein LIER_01719 [Lithospermum erythrorhizon]|uniref:Uncharacterized protein n=1 Tax=Lithospermum erythrorhizon TaxID=34254 RepID=A0AAV3NM05_LITER
MTVRASFTIVDIPDPSYNGLIGRPLLNALRAVVSPRNLKMKFRTSGGVGEFLGTRRLQGCVTNSRYREGATKDNDPKEKENEKHGEPHEELELVPFHEDYESKIFRVGTKLFPLHCKELIHLVREFEEVFAWGPDDITGVDADLALHRLHADSSFRPIKQKKTNFSN